MSGAHKLKSSQCIEVNEQSKDRVAPHCIGLANGLPPEQVLRLATELSYTHVVQKNGLEYAKELNSSEMLIDRPHGFFEFPVASVFAPSDLSPASEQRLIISDQQFNSSGQKPQVLENFTTAMQGKSFPQTFVSDALLIADEMFTNAVFNAPFAERSEITGRHNNSITFDLERPGRMILAADETRLMIACEDPYGSLNLTGYLSKIKATYDRGAAASMNFGSGGAGIGSYIIFNTSASLFVGVKSGRATIIASLLPLGLSNRKRALLPKHLHWIQL